MRELLGERENYINELQNEISFVKTNTENERNRLCEEKEKLRMRLV
jgi:hypothetical protein